MAHLRDMKHVQLQFQAGNSDSYPEHHRDARLSKAMTTTTTNNDNDNNTAISHRFTPEHPPSFHFIADDVIFEYEQHGYNEPDHNPSHPTINFDAVGTTAATAAAEVDDALQELSACVSQIINNNGNMKSKKNAHRGNRSTRGKVHIRSML